MIKHIFRDEEMVNFAYIPFLLLPSFLCTRFLFMEFLAVVFLFSPAFRQGLYSHLYLKSLRFFSPTGKVIMNTYWCMHFTALKLNAWQWLLSSTYLLCSQLCLLWSHFIRKKKLLFITFFKIYLFYVYEYSSKYV
jgi:hypothetical protein